jgi:hypothetical protein
VLPGLTRCRLDVALVPGTTSPKPTQGMSANFFSVSVASSGAAGGAFSSLGATSSFAVTRVSGASKVHSGAWRSVERGSRPWAASRARAEAKGAGSAPAAVGWRLGAPTKLRRRRNGHEPAAQGIFLVHHGGRAGQGRAGQPSGGCCPGLPVSLPSAVRVLPSHLTRVRCYTILYTLY